MSKTMMHAVRIHDYGDADVLRYEAVPIPEPGPGQVRVTVRAAGVNPADWKIRDGMVRELIPLAMPAVLGADVAGVVEAVGPGVAQWQPGDEVFGMIGITGAYAESVIAPAETLARKPTAVDFPHAAAVPLAALTAWQGLFEHAQLTSGQRVLIHAAAGGVGSFATQFAVNAGATVIATASQANHDYLRSLGVAQCIDYHTARFEEVCEPVDAVLDLMGHDIAPRSMQVLKPGGVLVEVAPTAPPVDDPQRRTRAVLMRVRPDGGQLARIGELIDAGKLKIEIAAVYPLREVAQAHTLSAAGHTRGKIVLRVQD